MARRLLLRSQQNQILPLIERAGLDPSDFDWRTASDPLIALVDEVSELVHVPTGSLFRFDLEQHGRHGVYYLPGEDTPYVQRETYGWDGVLVHVRSWLSNLVREASAPDLWAQVGRERRLFEAAATGALENSPFSPAEVELIGERLGAIEEHIASSRTLTSGERHFVGEKLDYVAKAAKRLGRADWLNLTIGALLNIATTLAMDGRSAKALFDVAAGVLSGLGIIPGPAPAIGSPL